MTVKQIKLKKNWEQLYTETKQNFVPLYLELDGHINTLDELATKKFKKGKDHVIFGEISLLQHGQKMLFESIENHALLLYAVREYLSDYGKAIDQLSTSIELLAKDSTDKNLTNRILGDLVSLKESVHKQDDKIQDARNEIEGIDKHWDDLFKNFSRKKGDRKSG